MSRVCAHCSKEFPDSQTFCTEDGNPLIAAAAALANTHLPDRMATQEGGPETSADRPFLAGHSTVPVAQAWQEPQLVELAPGTQVGEYIVEQQIGEGGMGVIFSARHPIIGKRVAIKVLNPDMAANASIVQRFIQEARSVNQIGHRNIVDIFSFGRLADGRHYFVMEFLNGQPLSKRLHDGLGWQDATSIWLQMAAAVEAAHARGIVHRDLKPDNLFVLDGGEGPFVKVLDFGIAKLMSGSDGSVSKTSTGVPMGTPLYMSPEQTRGGTVDHRTDIYAVGCILYETVVGTPPFMGASFFEIMSLHMTEPPPPIGARVQVLDPGLEELVFQCLEKDPLVRPSTMGEIRERLQALRDQALRDGRPLFLREGHPVPASPKASPDALTQRDESTQRPLGGRRAPAIDSANTVPEPRAQTLAPVPAAPQQSRPRAPIVLAGAIVLAVAGLASWGLLKAKPTPPVDKPAQVTPPTPPAAKDGKITLVATQSGLSVWLDGTKIAEGGPTLSFAAGPGHHEVKVTRPGFLPYSLDVVVSAGETTNEIVTLETEKVPAGPKPPPGPHVHKKEPSPPTMPAQPARPRDKDSTVNPFGN